MRLEEYLLEPDKLTYWRTSEGVWVPRKDIHGQQEDTDPTVEALLNRSKTIGWREAAKELPDGDPKLSSEHVLNELVGNLLYCSPGTCAGELALDVGCGVGGLLGELAEQFQWVIGLESSTERARFSKLRADLDGLKNVTIVNDILASVPLRHEIFDFAVVNAFPYREPTSTRDPIDAQLAFLQRLHSIIKPGGTLYLGAENRFSCERLLGTPGTYSGARCASGVSHSLREYLRLFEQAGFQNIHIRLPLPTCTRPAHIFDTTKSGLRYYARVNEKRSRFYKVGRLFPNLVLHTAHSFMFFCQK